MCSIQLYEGLKLPTLKHLPFAKYVFICYLHADLLLAGYKITHLLQALVTYKQLLCYTMEENIPLPHLV